MANEKLKAVLGDDGLAELIALIPQTTPAAPPTPWSMWIMGLVKSWTVWFGGLLLVLPDLLPALLPQLQETLSANTYKRVANVIGIIVIMLRFKTTQSLQVKGNPPGKETSA
jgi:hypothetical protein